MPEFSARKYGTPIAASPTKNQDCPPSAVTANFFAAYMDSVIEEQRRIAELEREVRELRRANEILKAASAFFAAELDPRLPRKS